MTACATDVLSLPGVPMGKELNAADVKHRRTWFSSGCPASQPVGPRPCIQERGASSPESQKADGGTLPGRGGESQRHTGPERSSSATERETSPLGHSKGFTRESSTSLGKTSPVGHAQLVVRVSEPDMQLRTLVAENTFCFLLFSVTVSGLSRRFHEGQSQASLCSPEAHDVPC